jgi:hypothetical protein
MVLRLPLVRSPRASDRDCVISSDAEQPAARLGAWVRKANPRRSVNFCSTGQSLGHPDCLSSSQEGIYRRFCPTRRRPLQFGPTLLGRVS